MSVWLWMQPGNKAWKVILDYEKGTIVVYDEKGEILLEKRGLSRAVISIVENNFLAAVATKLSEFGEEGGLSTESKSAISIDNPMYL
ncbi:MAG: hypothetical protein JSW00_03170 [Thermoplasmata archaeon]|nr:MAG: hypothetical protein JSW00_03170 [Thermoplasmata archaeon]